MLRQLLSAPIDELTTMSLPKPIPAGIAEPMKSETQEFAVLSNMAPNLPPIQHQYPIYYANPVHNYEYAQLTGSIHYPIDETYIPQTYSYISSTNGSTSDLFSSTYAVLSSDSEVSNEWTQYTAQPVEKVPPAQAYLDPYVQYNGSHIIYAASTNTNNLSADEHNKYVNYYPEMNNSYSNQDDSNLHNNLNGSQSNNATKSKSRASRAQAMEAFRRVAQIPIGKPVSPTNGAGDVVTNGDDDDTNERVMCLACKGVYPSRRSLTGHIGRNEKCREIIGRNYLDQMAQAAHGDIPDPTVSDGISPVCPHCDRFISHYKGNIRRHINQCVKAKGKRIEDPVASLGEPDVDSPLLNEPTSSTYFDYTHENDASSNFHYAKAFDIGPNIIQNEVVGSTTEHFENNQLVKNKKAGSAILKTFKESRPLSASASTTSDDPYICSWCNFKTVYKGNMKRHLISCHSTSDEALRQHKFDLEKLRATTNIRPTFLPTSFTDQSIGLETKTNGKPPKGRKSKNQKMDRKNGVEEESLIAAPSGSFKRKTSIACDSVINEDHIHLLPMKIPKDASVDSGVSLSSTSSIDET